MRLYWKVLVVVLTILVSIINFHLRKNSQTMSAPKREVVQLQTIPDNKEAEKTCVPQDDVYFVKIPKTASTTVYQIFVTYGVTRGLTFALLPLKSHVHQSRLIRGTRSPSNRYNMVVTHTLYTPNGPRQVLNEGFKTVTMVRDPVSRFESQWNYGRWGLRLGINIHTYIQSEKRTSRLLNVLAEFFGIRDLSDTITPKEMTERLQQSDVNFDLVMITEYFDESLVLMKHLLCWTTEDIVYAKAKIRTENHRTALSESEQNKLRQLNWQDDLLYNFFRRIFEQKVKAFGEERMRREVEELRRGCDTLLKNCGAELVQGDLLKRWKVKVKTNPCKIISMEGSTITRYLVRRQQIWSASNYTYDLHSWTFGGDLNEYRDEESAYQSNQKLPLSSLSPLSSS